MPVGTLFCIAHFQKPRTCVGQGSVSNSSSKLGSLHMQPCYGWLVTLTDCVPCRFVEGWDSLCLDQLQLAQQAAGSERVVLSTYPLGYSGEGPAAVVPEEAPATLLCAKEFDEIGLLRIQGR